METILNEPIAAASAAMVELAELTEQHAMIAMCHAFGGAMNEGEVYHQRFSERVCAVFCTTDLLYANRLMLSSTDLLNEDLVDEAIAFFRGKGRPRMMLHIPPFQFSDDHREMLRRKGGKFLSHWVKHFKMPFHAAEQTEIVVREARKEEHARIGEILLDAFAWPSSLLRFCRESLGKGGWTTYVAEFENEIAATGSLYIEDRAAVLGIGGTLPMFQRHGAQNALIRARENEAFNRGCEILFTETIEPTEKNPAPSFRNMKRNGFSELYRRANYVFEIGS